MEAFTEMQEKTTNKVSPAQGNIMFLISLAVPLTMMVFGGVYINSCPAEPYIPIYMIGAGGLYVVYALIKIFSTLCHDEEGKAPQYIAVILLIVALVKLGWFIAGNVWVYRLYNNFSPKYGDTNYCNNSLYLFAFWIINVTYILIAIGIIYVCCLCCCLGCMAACFQRKMQQ